VLMAGSALALRAALSQQPEIKRADAPRNDLGIAGREVAQVRVDSSGADEGVFRKQNSAA